VLENATGRFYIGSTDNLRRRLSEHKSHGHNSHKYTSRHTGPWRLVWFEEHASRSSAMLREKQIKRMKSVRWIRENLLIR